MKENPTRCAAIRADLKAFADDELSPFARLRVAHHLRGCPFCREELIQMQTLSTELQEAEGEIAPLDPELRAHILESVPAEEQADDEAVQLRRHRIYRKKMVLALGVCSIIGVLFVTTFTGSHIHNTFNKAADSMSTSDLAPKAIKATSGSGVDGGHSPSVIVGGATNGIVADGHLKYDKSSSFASRRAATDQAAPSTASSLGATSASNSIDVNPDNFLVVPPTRAVHRQGSLTVEVSNTENASDYATLIVKNAGGFIANGALETSGNQRRTATLDCRVPVAQFEDVVRKIGALGKVRAKSLNGEDITAQVVQSGARRQTLAQELAIAQARLDQNEKSKKKLGDTFQLRAEVRNIRIQASQARAQLEAFQKYGALSSLYVSLQDAAPTPIVKPTSWTDSLSPTSRAAWDTFLTNARLPLQFLMWALAYSPFWLPLLLVWRKFGRKWLME